MKINEKLVLSLLRMKIILSHYFSPDGRAGGFHLLRFLGRGIVHYSLGLKCLADESLQLVQNSGIRKVRRDYAYPGSWPVFVAM
jgi:hypothetical protein